MVNEVPVMINGLDVLFADEIKGIPEDYLLDYVNTPDGEGFTISQVDPGDTGCSDCTSC